MTYSFDTELAQKLGVNEAIMLQNIVFWLLKNKANGSNYYDGRYWTYNSHKAFKELFPFWTENQIRRILENQVVAKNLAEPILDWLRPKTKKANIDQATR